jgi:RNA polymerase sigma-70 factor (ECF subfamily)
MSHTKGKGTKLDWTDVMNEHGSALMLYARQWTGSTADAEEAVQNGFIRLWRSKYRDIPNPVPLLFTTVKRSAIDLARSRSRRKDREIKHSEEYPRSVVWFESSLEGDERKAEIQEAMKGLPEEQREVLVMKIWGDLTFREIAESLEISQNTVASRYRYALNALRNLLENRVND